MKFDRGRRRVLQLIKKRSTASAQDEGGDSL